MSDLIPDFCVRIVLAQIIVVGCIILGAGIFVGWLI